MGGEGYALEQAMSDTALAQLKSRENLARSDFPRRSPSEVFEWSWRYVGDCMELTLLAGRTRIQGGQSWSCKSPASQERDIYDAASRPLWK
jgi:hypothetical protein